MKLVLSLLTFTAACVILPVDALAAPNDIADTIWFVPQKLGDGYDKEAISVTPPSGQGFQNPNPCGQTGIYLLQATPSYGDPENAFKQKSALLMAAFLGRREIRLLIKGCTGGANASASWPRIVQVEARQPQ